ncbi:MAG: glycoside hydrolase [Flavisolibacter sp.]|nr:glycoside hydrolase [Flavisolibacter sp.]
MIDRIHKVLVKAVIIAEFVILSGVAMAQNSGVSLEQGFKNPPASAWPRTWWHWTNSNVTKEGITKDLEWMKRVGIAGMQLADVSYGSGQTVNHKIVFGSPEWLDAVRHAASEADRLNLEMALFTSAGWSLTGGPWVKPEQAMKKLVWSEMTIEGGKTFNGMLPAPPSNEGPIRNLFRGGNRAGSEPTFYGDCAVIAFRTPPDEQDLSKFLAAVMTNSGAINASPLLDDDLNTSLVVKPSEKKAPAWIQYSFHEPVKVQAMTIAGTRGIPFGRLLASEDGKSFKTLVVLPGKQGYRGGTVRTFAFPETKAKYFKLELNGAPMKPADVISEAPSQPDSLYALNEFKLYAGGRVHRWEDKAGFNFLFEYENTATPPVSSTSIINPSEIMDLTSKMSKDGTLRWEVPKGKWTVMRFGYSLTGAKNRPAVPSGLGYEVDKLSRKHTEAYMSSYTEPIAKALGPLYGKSLRYMLLDSWEAGIQNWTDEMLAEFQKRRGYDPTPLLPVMAGRVVKSADVSDRFLWDFRRTLVDMFAENHYGVITDFLHKQGIQTFGEAGGVSLETIEDALLYKKYVDIPMGEFWVKDLHPSAMYYEDVRGAASASHVYGKNLVAAESFTGGNYESPYTLKKISDYWFTQGVNRLVFHTSAHQPLDTKPGNTMVGTHLHRNITWAEFARPFMTYVARNSYMLQQGLYIADFVYLLNEGAPSTMPFWGGGLQPVTPKGYAFDYINADALLTRMAVDSNGKLMLPDGMRYEVLVLPQTDGMTVPVLRKLRDLVAGGATMIGPKPQKAPGLSGYPDADNEVKELANEIWGDLDGTSRTKRNYGKGKVFWGIPLEQVITALKIAPDVEYSGDLDSKLSWIHRKSGNTDIYFLVNSTDRPEDVKARFRVSGKDVELWNPATGQIKLAGYTITGNYTTVPLQLKEREAVFVVFKNIVSDSSRSDWPELSELLTTVKGPWEVHFAPNLGAPEKITLEELTSWTAHADTGIKYFSGAATYTKTLQAEKRWFQPDKRILLDLGKVGDMAEVTINGKNLDLIWKAPCQVDVTEVLKPGKNQLTIKVTNEWTNRLIGDKLLGPDKKILDTYIAPFGGEYQLSESGLIGPVKILSVSNDKTIKN